MNIVLTVFQLVIPAFHLFNDWTKRELPREECGMEFEVARRNMVESQVRPNGVTNTRVLEALETVAREQFVPENCRKLAYAEVEITFDGGRFLLTPLTFGRLLQLADLKSTDYVLDVGAASGYSTAVLARIVESVVGLECDEVLCKRADETLSSLDVTNAAIMCGKLEQGAPKQGPFDVVFVNGSVSQIPDVLVSQLQTGGRLVAVVRSGHSMRASVFHKAGDKLVAGDDFSAVASPLDAFSAQPVGFEF